MVVTADSWPLRSYLELGALPTAVPCARLHARQLAWEWGLDGLAESTELLVSELVTNAVQAMEQQDDQPAVRLRLSSDNARLLIEVWRVIRNQLRGQAVVSARRGVQGCPARASRMACIGGTALSLMVIR